MLAVKSYGGTDDGVEQVCRLCSSNTGILVLNIFDGEGKKRQVLSLITDCLPVQISENDPLPKVICHHCLHKLEVFHEFQKNCLKSEETLRNSTHGSSHAFKDTAEEYSEKTSFLRREYTEEPSFSSRESTHAPRVYGRSRGKSQSAKEYPENASFSAFRSIPQDYTNQPLCQNVPDFTAEIHPILPPQILPIPQISATAISEQHSEEQATSISDGREQAISISDGRNQAICVSDGREQETIVSDRESVEQVAKMEQVVVKEEPEDDLRANLFDEESRWDNGSGEDDSMMHVDHQNTEARHTEDDFKTEMCTTAESPIISEMNVNRSVTRRMNYRREIIKEARLSGNKYVNYSGKEVPAKTCGEPCGCHKNCFSRFSELDRREIFKHFYSFRNKDAQDAYLQSLINTQGIKRRRPRNPFRTRKPRANTFVYHVMKGQERVTVCKKALMNLFNISSKRLRRLAELLVEGKLPRDLRGHHSKNCINRLHTNDGTVQTTEIPINQGFQEIGFNIGVEKLLTTASKHLYDFSSFCQSGMVSNDPSSS